MQKDQKAIQNKDLNYYVTKIQKPLLITVFVLAILFFVYSLIFMTPFYEIYLYHNGIFTKSNLAKFGINYKDYAEECWIIRNGNFAGLNMANFSSFTNGENMQAFNHWMFNFGFIGIVVSCLLFISRSTKRKTYYLFNYIINAIVSCFGLYVGLSLLIQLTNWQAVTNNVDFYILNAYYSSSNSLTEVANYYSPSTFSWVFTSGYILSVIIIIANVSLLGFTGSKFAHSLKHKPIDVSGVKIYE